MTILTEASVVTVGVMSQIDSFVSSESQFRVSVIDTEES